MKSRIKRVVIKKAPPDQDNYDWYIPNFVAGKTMYFKTLDEAIDLCNTYGYDWAVE